MTKPIIQAATAALTCGDELYLTLRQPQVRTFSGYYAFTGGKVDAIDGELESALPGVLEDEPVAFVNALCREILEELNFDLPSAWQRGEVERIDLLGVAVTPAFMPVRFDTHCYRVVLKSKPEFKLDQRELASGEWASAKEFAQRYEQGRLLAAPPTVAIIKALAADAGVSFVPQLAHDYNPQTHVPCVEMLRGVWQMPTRSHTIPPADRTNVFMLGDTVATRFLIDPAPMDEAEMQRLLATATQVGFSAIFLTHHHPDHRERADVIARQLNIPIHVSADSHARIQQKTGKRFFEGVQVVLREEGEVLTHWQGEPVQILAVPGHDEGQLALMPQSRSWCIVSDLITAFGTVVIAPPEGNMKKYFASLERMIELDPAVIFPSHGPALGTTHKLKETLLHRQQREAQVLALHAAGKDERAMLEVIYPGLDERLLPLALCNISSHLDKLRSEGRLT